MPIYQRTCTKCNFTEENIERMSEGEVAKDCPECGEINTFTKDISTGTAFKFSGECNASDGYSYEYTDCKANAAGKGDKSKILRHHNLDKKLKKRGFLADEEK